MTESITESMTESTTEPMIQARRTVAVVPHTHWDREWYEPFQVFRARLVEVVDEVLRLLEDDPSYRHFLLDGQTQVVDDYLEVRPEAEELITRLVTEGRLSVGPWMILMDEFMVSGETIVRDLQMGIARAARLGGAMPVGYLPDMFGHVAQMPQILRLAGLRDAVVWRGVPGAIRTTAFRWVAPDGSWVRAEYLRDSYSNAQDLPTDPDTLLAMVGAIEAHLGDALAPGAPLLLMNGTDHQAPQPWAGRVVAEANARQDRYRFVVSPLPDVLAGAPVEGLPTWTGELRSGARANVLMGVASNRVDVHQAAAAAERALERRAEPMTALFLPPPRHPHRLLETAWRHLVCNAAHDSSCACSHDEVVDAVLVRYAEARQIGDTLARSARRALARSVDAPPLSTVVANPTPADRSGLITLSLPGTGPVHLVAVDDGTPVPTQEVVVPGGDDLVVEGALRDVGWLLQTMHGTRMAAVQIGAHEVVEGPDGIAEHVFSECRPPTVPIDLTPLRTELLATAAEGRRLRLRVRFAPVRRLLAHVPRVPGHGWRTFTAREGPAPTSRPVEAGTTHLDNGELRVEVDDDGTWSLRTATGIAVDGAGRLVDGGDGGDTYNWSPPAEDRIVDRPEAVRVEATETGPLRARLVVRATYRWPTHALGDMVSCRARADTEVEVEVETVLELRAGEPFVRVTHRFENRARDHRLRAHFPLPAPAAGSAAECAFAVVERGLEAEGGPHEPALATFVSRRFVTAGDGRVGLALIHDGLLEYEVVDGGRTLALTLLRATGYLSRAAPIGRPNPAGPLLPLRGAQMPGPVEVRYAVLPHHGSWIDAALYERADEVLVPLERAPGGGGHERPPTGQALRVQGAVVSALHRHDGHLVLRCFNPYPEPVDLAVEAATGPARGWEVDLRHRLRDPFAGTRRLRPGEIVTLRLDEPATHPPARDG